jgi:hypothetical protein
MPPPTAASAPVRLPRQAEDALGDHAREDEAAIAATSPDKQPDRRELRGLREPQLPATPAEHAHHAAFEQAFVLAGADRREQHEDARREREPEHHLHDDRYLVGRVAHLRERGFDVDDGGSGSVRRGRAVKRGCDVGTLTAVIQLAGNRRARPGKRARRSSGGSCPS